MFVPLWMVGVVAVAFIYLWYLIGKERLRMEAELAETNGHLHWLLRSCDLERYKVTVLEKRLGIEHAVDSHVPSPDIGSST